MKSYELKIKYLQVINKQYVKGIITKKDFNKKVRTLEKMKKTRYV